MQRVSLYYPSITIPDGIWLRNAILYSDKIATIIPYESFYEESEVIKQLRDHDFYKAIPAAPTLSNLNENEKEDFEKGFIDLISSPQFINKSAQALRRPNFNQYELFLFKFTRNLRSQLIERGELTNLNQTTGFLNRYLAVSYMALLSDLLARKDIDLVTPSTDYDAYQQIGFQFGNNHIKTHKLELANCLPAININVGLKKIIKFRLEREAELTTFRTVIDDVQTKLNNAETDDERKLIIISFTEKLNSSLIDMKKMFGSSKIEFTLNSCSSLLNFKKPEILGTIGTVGAKKAIVALGLGKIVAASALPFVATGAGAVILTTTAISAYRKSVSELNKNSLSYLYYAQRTKLIA